DTTVLTKRRQLLFCDARTTLDQFLDGGRPNWHQFEKVIGDVLRQVRPLDGTGSLRAYGEMVDLLWKDGQFASAVRLEQLWNKLLERSSFSLYCAYEVDVFGPQF